MSHLTGFGRFPDVKPIGLTTEIANLPGADIGVLLYGEMATMAFQR